MTYDVKNKQNSVHDTLKVCWCKQTRGAGFTLTEPLNCGAIEWRLSGNRVVITTWESHSIVSVWRSFLSIGEKAEMQIKLKHYRLIDKENESKSVWKRKSTYIYVHYTLSCMLVCKILLMLLINIFSSTNHTTRNK